MDPRLIKLKVYGDFNLLEFKSLFTIKDKPTLEDCCLSINHESKLHQESQEHVYTRVKLDFLTTGNDKKVKLNGFFV